MNNYNTDIFNLPQETLKNVNFTLATKIDNCNVLVIKADTIGKKHINVISVKRFTNIQ